MPDRSCWSSSTREPALRGVRSRWTGLAAVLVSLGLLVAAIPLWGQQYVRPVETAPSQEDIGEGYKTPAVQRPLPMPVWRHSLDVALLALAMGLGAWIVLKRRSRNWLVVLTIACLVYFGFVREGCICPIGAIQNVSVAVVDPTYAISHTVILLFFLPLGLALLFGRVFCGGVCPLGAIQDLVLLRPVQVPRRLDKALGVLKYVYLGVAVWYAVQPAVARDFVICRFDPFVGLFRQTGPGHMLILGGVFLFLGVAVGRPYCRYLCPYGALLALLSRFSWRRVVITPSGELDCGLCTEACPFGAIEGMRAVRSTCLYCARCYSYCPKERANWCDQETLSVPSTEAPSR